MKRSFFYFAASTLLLSACTSENVIEDAAATNNAIQFETVVNKQSRAVDLTLGNLTKFQVYGFYTMPDNPKKAHAVFNNLPVTYSESGVCTYSPDSVRDWVSGATYYFFAYSCGNKDGLSETYGKFKLDINDATDSEGMDMSKRSLEIDNYICDETHQHDLIFASQTGYTAQDGLNSSVSFSFKHILSKLKANFTSKFPSEYDVVIKNVTVRNVRNEGDYQFSTGWTNVTRSKDANPLVFLLNTTAEENPDAPLTVPNKLINGSQMSVQTNTAFVIPCEYQAADVNLNFEVDVMYGNDYVIKNKVLTATFKPEWKEGFFYTYNVEISPENINMKQIEFTVTAVKNWDVPTPDPTQDNPYDIAIDK